MRVYGPNLISCIFFYQTILEQQANLKNVLDHGVRRQGSKCPSLPGLTHWVNPGLPGLGFKPYFGKVGNTGE